MEAPAMDAFERNGRRGVKVSPNRPYPSQGFEGPDISWRPWRRPRKRAERGAGCRVGVGANTSDNWRSGLGAPRRGLRGPPGAPKAIGDHRLTSLRSPIGQHTLVKPTGTSKVRGDSLEKHNDASRHFSTRLPSPLQSPSKCFDASRLASRRAAQCHKCCPPGPVPLFDVLESTTVGVIGPECIENTIFWGLAQTCAQWPHPSGNLGAWCRATRGAGSRCNGPGGVGNPSAVLECPRNAFGRRLDTLGMSPEALGRRLEAFGMSPEAHGRHWKPLEHAWQVVG